MYFDRRLWQLTRGLRGWIALAVLLGLVAAVVGIARFAILGVLLSRVWPVNLSPPTPSPGMGSLGRPILPECENGSDGTLFLTMITR